MESEKKGSVQLFLYGKEAGFKSVQKSANLYPKPIKTFPFNRNNIRLWKAV